MPNVPNVDAQQTPDTRHRGPWGPFASVGFAIVIAVLFLVAQTIVAIPYLMFQTAGSSEPNLEEAALALETDGLFIGISEPIAGGFAMGLILFVAWIRRGPTVRDYLALRSVGLRKTLPWMLSALVLTGLLDGFSYLFGYAIVPAWMEDVYDSAVVLPLLLFAMVIVAPVLEELFFRGFLFEGLRHSWLHDLGAILVTSCVWAGIHLQYEWFYIGQIFVLGLLLGLARSRTVSLVPPLLMHSLLNSIASIQVML